jgi:hypothetical protein
MQHGHPITFAYLSRVPAPEVELMGQRLFRSLMHQEQLTDPVGPEEQQTLQRYLIEHRFKYYLTHQDSPDLDRFVTQVLGGRKIAEDPGRVSYLFPYVQ